MSAPPLLPAVRGGYDAWRTRLAADTRLRRRWEWAVPAFIALVAAVLRLWRLGDPHAIVFDETYYVKDAWSQWNLGYASTWPDDADARFTDGDTDAYTGTGSYVVHPPLGKYVIGLGMWLFGAEHAFAWRVGTAAAGVLTVLVLYALARHLSGSFLFAGVAAGLLAVDGLAIVMSRVALLDGILTLFVLLAVWFVLLDRSRHLARLRIDLARRRAVGDAPPAWGPVFWNRPWLLAAGAAAGAASAVKWSGVWVLAALGLYVVVTDALERRRGGVGFWPTDAALRQGVVSFLLMVPVALAVYLASWTGWLLSDGGYDRHVADADPATGFFSWVPLPLQSLWRYHEHIYASMAGMSTAHSYMSPAWQWPLLWRPTSMYAATTPDGEAGCEGANGCIAILYSMPNPLVWWAAVLAAVWLAWRFAVRRDWRDAVVLVGIGATWLPWLAYPERTVFQFYTVVMLPFLLLALTFALQRIAAPAPATDAVDDDAEWHRRQRGRRVVAVFLVVVLAVAVFWYPLWSAVQVPYEFYRLHNWLGGWV